MMSLGKAAMTVTTALPPSTGEYSGWNWQAYYNAVLHVLQNPTSQLAYREALQVFVALPPRMKLTPQQITAGWARFTQLYPGWKYQDYRNAYHTMETMLHRTGRLLPDDKRQWWVTEYEWQEMEFPGARR